MSRKKKTSSSIDEYELIPIQPLHDLKREVKSLRKGMEKENNAERLLVKLLNSNLQTQQKIIEQNYKLEEIKTHMQKFINVIRELDLEDDSGHEFKKLHTKIDGLHDKHDHLTRSFKQIQSNESFTAFRRLPSGIPVKYRRRHDK
jgi:small-conductance mechanosensitive channel